MNFQTSHKRKISQRRFLESPLKINYILRTQDPKSRHPHLCAFGPKRINKKQWTVFHFESSTPGKRSHGRNDDWDVLQWSICLSPLGQIIPWYFSQISMSYSTSEKTMNHIKQRIDVNW